jgi:hypothetical protein
MGTLEIRIPTPNGGFLPVNVDVISINVPFLIGLDFLDREGLNCLTVENKLTCLKDNWSVPLERKLGHVYWKWDHDTILFTKSELQRLHLHFYHPSVRKLYNLIRRAKPHEATSDTRALLEEITEACKTCQHISKRPYRFRVSMPEDIIFNQDLALDLMWLDGQATLHIVDTRTYFSSAAILKRQTVEGAWYAFLDAWATLYLGYPDTFKLDQ